MTDFPIKSTKRAQRRSSKRRKINQAKQVAKIFGVQEKWIRPWAARNADNLKKCSCPMCGNQRRHYGKTFQELKYSEPEDF